MFVTVCVCVSVWDGVGWGGVGAFKMVIMAEEGYKVCLYKVLRKFFSEPILSPPPPFYLFNPTALRMAKTP